DGLSPSGAGLACLSTRRPVHSGISRGPLRYGPEIVFGFHSIPPHDGHPCLNLPPRFLPVGRVGLEPTVHEHAARHTTEDAEHTEGRWSRKRGGPWPEAFGDFGVFGGSGSIFRRSRQRS